jgi:L-amino acid N-acyltransferase YncA
MIDSKKIRLVHTDDCTSLLNIYGPFISDTTVTFEYEIPDADAFKERIINISKTNPWLVCELNEKVVGYAYASRHRERAAYQWSVELSVYVDPEYHRHHIAKALYTALIKILKIQGYYNAYAGITMPNEKSERFHESFGFKLIGVYESVGYKFGRWLDVGWYWLKLAEHIKEPQHPKPITEICKTKEVMKILDEAVEIINL